MQNSSSVIHFFDEWLQSNGPIDKKILSPAHLSKNVKAVENESLSHFEHLPGRGDGAGGAGKKPG